ncbi:MAG: plasma membrane localization protein [Vezdaea acicularis]|nr:MAG: plasma membrane localization protein [Vezdaea acicularis]
MEAVRHRCRPKHQVLVLKCYPKLQKSAVDVKPNSSELNYLLYYVGTRRSKLQKVADFLEKRISHDVAKGRLGNVQVTLQILKALIEKSPRDLPLFAPSLLNILGTILRKQDLTMVEESIQTFEPFCQYHDGASLAANQDYLRKYEEIVKRYASCALRAPTPNKGQKLTAPILLRWRKVGLLAIKSVASSEALSSDEGRQLGVILPVILANLYSNSTDHLIRLHQRAHSREQSDTEKSATRRKMSISTVRTNTEQKDAEIVSRTTADADKLAEEDISLLALQSLKQIFISRSRGQIRTATAIVLRFIEAKASESTIDENEKQAQEKDGTWGMQLLETIARWAPVQDRFVILISAMEVLVKCPLREEKMNKQLVLANLINRLLSSNVNLIGLSVMDVLLGLINHVLRLLNINDAGTAARTDFGIGTLEAGSSRATSVRNSTAESAEPEATTSMEPSKSRQDLLERLQSCIGNLATHIYYSDQVSDMIEAILLRLKPSPMSSVGSTALAIDDPEATAQAISDSANFQEDPNAHDFFSFANARVIALNAIKRILNVANARKQGSTTAGMGRNKVGVQIWDGTQWLLRDVEGAVRQAYVDALLTWLRREVVKGDSRALDNKPSLPKQNGKSQGGDQVPVKRPASNRLNKERQSRFGKSTFLQLLHLAIYENAIQYSESESDILLLFLLLTNLIEKLGINAVKSSLPMIVRLQEDIQVLESPTSKVYVGSLVHGYFWALSEKFDFESSAVGAEIQAEISRRKSRGLWVARIRLPPVPVEQIIMSDSAEKLNSQVFETESLRPFDSRAAMVECIAAAYAISLASPPASPANSPGRVFTMPLFGSPPTSNPTPQISPEHQMPAKIKEEMLSDWSKESLIASVEKDSAKTASLNGSRTGTNPSGTHRAVLLGLNGYGTGPSSGTHTPRSYRNSRPPSQNYGLGGGDFAGPHPRLRKGSGTDRSPTPLSSSSRDSMVRVDELKRVLSGRALIRTSQEQPDESSESMVSGGFSDDQSFGGHDMVDFGLADGAYASRRSRSRERTDTDNTVREGSMTPRAGSYNPHALNESDELAEEHVPPVPPIPSSLNLPGGFPSSEHTSDAGGSTPPAEPAVASYGAGQSERRFPSRNRSAGRSRRGKSTERRDWSVRGAGNAGPGGGVNFGDLLGGIQNSALDDGEGEGMGVGRPPY